MTEEEWMGCTNFPKMLLFLREKVSARKLRLFICACCRSSWRLLEDKRFRQAVIISERFADGVASKKNLETALANAKAAARTTRSRLQEPVTQPEVSQADEGFPLAWVTSEMILAVQRAVEGDAWESALAVAGSGAMSKRTGSYLFMRDIIGNHFYPVSLDLSWKTLSVLGLAQAAYNERILPSGLLELDRLSILADALEDAGCSEAVILDHLRGPGPHVRGCWCVDLLMGKT